MRRRRSTCLSLILATGAALLVAAAPALARCTAHSRDSDHDGVPNCQERKIGTNPRRADTDHDGLSDGLELRLGTRPTVADSDGDGREDGAEMSEHGDPTDERDGDGGQAEVDASLEDVQGLLAGAFLVLLCGQLTVQTNLDTRFEGVEDVVDLEAKLEQARMAGHALRVEVRLGAQCPPTATKVEVKDRSGDDDDDDEGDGDDHDHDD